jgi:uncharacterized protein (DUF302 family)
MLLLCRIWALEIKALGIKDLILQKVTHMKSNLMLALLCLPMMVNAQTTTDDWITVTGIKSMQETVESLQKAIQAKGFKVFNAIDHAAGAAQAGMMLRSTTVIIFGNPKGGTPLMNCDQRMGIILPLKILVWEDEQKQVKVGFINPEKYLKEYDLEECQESVGKMKAALTALLSTVEKG